MLHVRHLPVVEIAQYLIFSEHLLHVFYLLFVRLWDGAHNLLKFLIEQLQGVGCVFAVSCPSFPGLGYGGQFSQQWCLTVSAKFYR